MQSQIMRGLLTSEAMAKNLDLVYPQGMTMEDGVF